MVDSSVETVEFENGIETIPEKALFRAKNTTEVILPTSVKTIGNSAFEYSGLTSLTLPEGIETIGYRVLYGNTGVKELTIPGSVRNLNYSTYSYGGGTFENSGLEKVIIKKGLTIITPQSFLCCKSLNSITIPDSVTKIGERAFCWCTSLESVDLPNSIMRIDAKAFQDSGLKELVLPDQIESLGSGILTGNTGITYLKIPKTLTYAESRYSSSDYGMLEGSAVATVEFEEGIETIPEKALYRAQNTTTVILPSSVKTIGDSAFENSGLTSLTLPNGVETIGYRVIYGNKGIKELTIPGSVKNMNYNTYYYGGGTFENSALETVTIEDGVATITPQAFLGCEALTSITIPDSVTSIGEDAFCRCTALESIDLPDSITRIYARAFQYTGLKELVLPARIESLGSGILTGNTGITYLKIPKTLTYAESRYSSSDYGMLEGSAVATVEFEEGIEAIPEKALFRASSTTDVIIPSSVKIIGTSAFENSGLTSLVLPNGIETIGYRVLYGNTGVKELTIPGSVKNLNYNTYYYGGGTFQNSALEKVIIEEGVSSIPQTCFRYCSELEEITIPYSVNQIGDNAFDGCTKLIIYGFSLSYAESFATINSISFTSLGEYESKVYLIGDTNLDGNITISDVTAIQRHLAELELFTNEQLALADTNDDGIINITDATHLQKYLAEFDGIVLGKQST